MSSGTAASHGWRAIDAARLMDRRDMLRAGGVLAATSALGLRTAQKRQVVFGANHGWWSQVAQDVPLLGAVRIYYDVENDIPTQWPTAIPAWVTLSVRPHPADLLSGKLDAALHALISSAPPHSELTFWHENTSGNPLHYPSYINNPAAAVAVQKYGHRLCVGTNVGFGVITCGPAGQQHAWVAPGLHWYGDDLYEFPRLRASTNPQRKAKLLGRLNENLAFWRVKSGLKWPKIRICESNSPFDGHRENWFTWLADWMAWHNGHRLLTYWNANQGLAQGGLSGPWPPGAGTKQTLRALSQTYH